MMHTAEFFEEVGTLDSALGCTLRSQTDSKMTGFRVFVLATSFDFVLSKNVLSKKDSLNNL